MYVKGIARVDKRTKRLVKRLAPHEIAIINHPELDDVAARSLVEARVRAVINAAPSLSERYPNPGPLTLVQAGVVLVDNAGEDIMDSVAEGQEVEIRDGLVFCQGRRVASGHILTVEEIKQKMALAQQNMGAVISRFVENTLEHARHEMSLIKGEYQRPFLHTSFQNKHVLIVVRGHNYKEDLNAIKSYIDEMRPVLVGVDGGADALIEFGYRPDIIVGDMDSVSDKTLRSGAELVVHAYPDGRAPGLQRIQQLGLKAAVFAAPGTSEDIAMLLAYDGGAELIVAVGTHFCVEDFLEKGRQGMGSTFLVRLKVGSILVDAKGVSKLYRNRIKARYLAQIVLAALLPAAVVVVVSPATRELLRLLYIHFRLLLGI
ncbi:putative cytokinetic ring protein SteA [Desulfofundulus sp.]|uniref:putative cytokinetic ring protein SteA n=1 Tax=Desulfofundulus sp. TaxID=2282750 RepID=UPI003C7717E3